MTDRKTPGQAAYAKCLESFYRGGNPTNLVEHWEAIAQAAIDARLAQSSSEPDIEGSWKALAAYEAVVRQRDELTAERDALRKRLDAVQALCDAPDGWDMACRLDGLPGVECVHVASLRKVLEP